MIDLTRVMLIALCTAAACQTPRVRPLFERATLDSLNAALDTAFRAGDPVRVAGYFSTDANLALIGAPDINGRDAFAGVLAVVGYYAAWHGDALEVYRHALSAAVQLRIALWIATELTTRLSPPDLAVRTQSSATTSQRSVWKRRCSLLR